MAKGDERTERLVDLGVCEGDTHHVMRERDGEVSVGHVQKLRDGQSLNGRNGTVYFTDDDGSVVGSYDVGPGGEGHGPVQVASEAYRSGWDAVFVRRGKYDVQ